MEGLFASLAILGIIALVIGIAYAASVYEIKQATVRNSLMEAWGHARGLQLLDRPNPDPAPFRRTITGVGRGKVDPLLPIALLQQGWCHNFVEGQIEGRLVWVFEHYYIISSGKSSRRIDHTVVAIGLRRLTPRFDLRPHTFWDKVRSLFGYHDIEIGEEEFDDKFYISSTDEAYIRRLLDPSTRELLYPGKFSWHCLNGFVVHIGEGQYREDKLNEALERTLLFAQKVEGSD